MNRKKLQVYPLNRVEGDLEIQIEVEDNMVVDARCAGIMYRGFENLLVGRAPLDGLVLTPRICGICCTSHLLAAAKSLDMFYKVDVPDNARRVRNVTSMAEMIQNDLRHAFLMFMPDFIHPRYSESPLYDEAQKRYAPLKGASTTQAVRETNRLLEIIAILGGQWPHSSFMVPGGVVSVPSANDINQCLFLLKQYRRWFEIRILGCSIDRWLDIKSAADLNDWVDEAQSHARSDLGFYLQLAEMAGLQNIGQGHANFICSGSLDMPKSTEIKKLGGASGGTYLPAGFCHDLKVESLNQENIREDVSHSWFSDADFARHPFEGVTVPHTTGRESGRYTWAKAPRYAEMPAETGPLAEMVVGSVPLFVDIIRNNGPSVFVRELARMVRTAHLLPVMEKWLAEIVACKEEFYSFHGKMEDGEGFGLIEAPRGSLGHWVKIRDKKINRYQIITPTAWNASPRDVHGVRGPWEEALVGTQIQDLEHPIEVDHIIRSFDPCLVCTVHAVDLKTGSKIQPGGD
ncbi:MAG: nickel-dependent hydrogenase large subunit [Planctomycetota bacterium]|jgi:hydrogenase large subunit